MRHTAKRRIGAIGNLFPSRWITLLMAALMGVAIARPACAAEDDTSWRIGLEFAWVDPSGDFATTSVDDNTVRASFDTGYGAGVRGEYRLARQYGVELSACLLYTSDAADE